MPVPPKSRRLSPALILALIALPLVLGLVLLDRFRPRGQPDESAPGTLTTKIYKVEEEAQVTAPTAPAEPDAEMKSAWESLTALMEWLDAQPGVPFRVRELVASFGSAQQAEAWAERLSRMAFNVLGRINLPGGGVIMRLGWENGSALDGLAALVADGQEPPFDLGLNYLYTNPPGAEPRADGGLSGTTPSGSDTLAQIGAAQPGMEWGAGVRVAVLDSGIYPHQVFGANVPSVVDLLNGVPGLGAHGTAVASLITGDALGQVGVAPGSEVTMYRVLTDDGVGDAFTVAQGIYASLADGAQILNLSLAGAGDSPVLRQAIEYAQSQGAVVVAAVGNDMYDVVSFPAAYPDVIGVGAVDATNTLVSFSNIGEGVDLTAPGLGVWAGSTRDGYLVSFDGTSASTPLIPGAIAAVMTRFRIDAAEAATILQATADDYGAPGFDNELGAGVINVERALNYRTPGIVDAAAVGVATSTGSTPGKSTVQVGVQNRGTENIAQAVVKLTTGGSTYTATVSGLKPGQTGTANFQWPNSVFGKQGTVTGTLSVQMLGSKDSKPTNDSRAVVIVKP